jgi:hypothetical protein
VTYGFIAFFVVVGALALIIAALIIATSDQEPMGPKEPPKEEPPDA